MLRIERIDIGQVPEGDLPDSFSSIEELIAVGRGVLELPGGDHFLITVDRRLAAVADLVEVLDRLRDPDGGCPWDLEQTHESLRRHMLEEAYEAVEAIEQDDGTLPEELGDVLLQVVLHARIGQDEGVFDLGDVADGIAVKLRRRHPHIFGDAVADTPDDVMRRWERIKRDEKENTGLLDSIPRALPALAESLKISKRAVSVGFEWESIDGVWEKLYEEIDELKATDAGTKEAADEIGDLLFTAVNLARKLGVDAEEALRGTNAKFRNRWASMEAAAADSGASLDTLDIQELEKLWQQAKDTEER